MTKMEPFTYGGSAAAVRLTQILEEINDPWLTKRVGRIMGQYFSRAKFIRRPWDGPRHIQEDFERLLLFAYRVYLFEDYDQVAFDIPLKVKTHMYSVMKGAHKEFIREMFAEDCPKWVKRMRPRPSKLPISREEQRFLRIGRKISDQLP